MKITPGTIVVIVGTMIPTTLPATAQVYKVPRYHKQANFLGITIGLPSHIAVSQVVQKIIMHTHAGAVGIKIPII